MPTTRISYSTATPYGALISEMAAHIIKGKQLADRVKVAMDSMSSAPATDSVQIATELGQPTPSGSTGAGGVGNLLYSVIANASVNMAAAVGEMNKIDQGVDV